MDAREREIPPAAFGADVRGHWMLREDVAFVNHGSFGSVPRAVFEEQDRWRRRIEAEPIELLGRQCLRLLDESKAHVGRFLNMRSDDFGFVTNATEGINAVLRSLEPSIKPGDELLTTTHVYNAIRQAMRYVAMRRGATYREIELPMPVASAEQIAGRILDGVTARTRLVLIDHVSSSTALVFPVERIVGECMTRGIDVIVDGAHAPGMLPLDVDRLGAAYYAGNLHKWVCAPKGSGFIHVRADRRETLHPTIISHFLGEGLVREFGWQGTRDISNWLSIPKAIEFMSGLGWGRVMEHNHAMAAWAHGMLARRWSVERLTPMDGSLLGSMATLRLPPKLASLDPAGMEALQQRLYSDFQVEAPLFPWGGEVMLRVSCQVYNRVEDYERVGDAIERLARP